MTKRTDDLLAFIDQTLYANSDHDSEIKWSNQEVLDLLADIRTKVVATVSPQPLVVTTLEELCEALEPQGDGQLVLRCSVGGLWAVTSDEDGDYIYQHVFGDEWSEISDFFTTHILPAEVLTRLPDAAENESEDKSTETPAASAQSSEDSVRIDGPLVTLNMRGDRAAARAIAIYAGMTRHLDPARSARIHTAASWYLPAAETLYALEHDWDGSLEHLLSDQPAGPRPTDFDLHQLSRLLEQAPNSDAATKLYLAVLPDLLPKLMKELIELRSRKMPAE